MSLVLDAPAYAVIELDAGGDFPGSELTVTEADGTGYDSSALTLEFSIRDYDDQGGDARVAITSSASSGDRILWLDRPNGKFQIIIDRTTLAGLPRNNAATNEATSFRWGLRATENGFQAMLAHGDLRIKGVVM